MARWKVHGDFLFALIEHFSLSITVLELWGEICTAFLQGVDVFALKFYLARGPWSSFNHSWHQKTRESGPSDGEDHIPLRSLVLTQYRSVADGQTDRQTDGYAVACTITITITIITWCTLIYKINSSRSVLRSQQSLELARWKNYNFSLYMGRWACLRNSGRYDHG